MLKKLIKYDMKYIGRIMLLIYLVAFGLSVLTAALAYGSIKIELLGLALVPLMFFFILSIIAVSVSGFIMMAIRIYKNMYTDEGYLTFTLPVTPTQLIWSKILTSIIWELLGIIVAIVCVCIPLSVYFINFYDDIAPYLTLIIDELRYILQTIMNSEYAAPRIASAAVSILYFIVALLGAPLQMLFSFSIGQIAKKYRVLFALLVYYGFNVAVSIVTSIVQFAIAIPSMLDSMSGMYMTDDVASIFSLFTWQSFASMTINLCILIVAYSICYISTHHIMSSKLNLI